MRRKDRQINDHDFIEQMLKESTICRIAIYDDEYPYILPLNYGYKENCLFMHCAKEGRKIDLLKKNNKVGFLIEYQSRLETGDQSCDYTTTFQSIIGEGSIDILELRKDKIEALNCIMEQHGRTENSYVEKYLDMMHALRLNIHNITAKQNIR